MTKKNSEDEELEVDILGDVKPAEILPELDLLAKEKEFLKNVHKEIEKRIEKDDPYILKSDISETFSFKARLITNASKAEKFYRAFKKQTSKDVPKALRSENRKYWVEGHSCNYRYQRDIIAGYLKALDTKLSAQKSILQFLAQELRNVKYDD